MAHPRGLLSAGVAGRWMKDQCVAVLAKQGRVSRTWHAEGGGSRREFRQHPVNLPSIPLLVSQCGCC